MREQVDQICVENCLAAQRAVDRHCGGAAAGLCSNTVPSCRDHCARNLVEPLSRGRFLVNEWSKLTTRVGVTEEGPAVVDGAVRVWLKTRRNSVHFSCMDL